MVKASFLLLSAIFSIVGYAQEKDTVYLIFDADARQRVLKSAMLLPGNAKDTIAVKHEYTFANPDPDVSRYDSATRKLMVKGRTNQSKYGTFSFTNIDIRNEKAYDSLYNKQIKNIINSIKQRLKKRDVYKLSPSEIRDMNNYANKLSSSIRKVDTKVVYYKVFLRAKNYVVRLSSIKTIDELRRVIGNNIVYIVDVAEMGNEYLIAREVIRFDLLDMQPYN
jgi:hypothetical protein